MATKSCIFCGRKPVTKEHILPRWVAPVLEAEKPSPSQPGAIVKYRGSRGKDGVESDNWLADAPELVVRAVCAACNNGWMSEVELSCREPLEAMIRGQPTLLDTGAQARIARWLALRAMVWQAARREPLPDFWLRSFVQAGLRAPTTWQARIGRYDGSRLFNITLGPTAVTAAHPLVLQPQEFEGFRFTTRVGKFTGQILAARYQTSFTKHPDLWLEIWPHPLLRLTDEPGRGTQMTVDWPPRRSFDDASYGALAGRGPGAA